MPFMQFHVIFEENAHLALGVVCKVVRYTTMPFMQHLKGPALNCTIGIVLPMPFLQFNVIFEENAYLALGVVREVVCNTTMPFMQASQWLLWYGTQFVIK